jgi:hypothetical protein
VPAFRYCSSKYSVPAAPSGADAVMRRFALRQRGTDETAVVVAAAVVVVGAAVVVETIVVVVDVEVEELDGDACFDPP